ncbi:MAG TPA: prepilin-type N-terminal cleavage/methylation domain-containing protein [Proteobacteria bacterium]|nr:prepilin-type N-terminal cleavage/methylation domain-containing protein [Pseudomonadota bacterium]
MTSNRNRSANRLTAHGGFTLVELMVVITITSLIAAFTYAEMHSSGYRLKSTARTLRAKMQQARLLAVRENCNVLVDFDINDDGAIDSCFTLWRDLDNDNTYDGAAELLETVTLPSDIAFGAVTYDDGGPGTSASGTASVPASNFVSFSGNRVRFSPAGTASNGWVYLHTPNQDSSGTYAVGSNNVGRIQSRYWATGGGTWR